MQHRASARDFSSAAEAAAGCWLCSKMLLLFFSRCKKQTPSTGVCSQQDSVLYAFEHLQYSISGFAPKEQNCANVVTKSFVFLNDLFTGAVKKLILIVLLYYAEVTMESFCSLDELVADAKKHFLVLIKFGTLENLKSLQNGSLYMKNLRYYNELESIDSDGKPDKYDGKWSLRGGNIVIMDPDTSALIAVGTAKETVFSFGHEQKPVFCLFSCDDRNCGEYKIDGNKCIFRVFFSDEQVERLKKGLDHTR